jgi:hypothetical protein
MRLAVADLAKFPGVWRGGELENASHPVVPTGHPALDRELPGGGWPTGTLSEVLHDGVGIGEVSFLAGALVRACADGRLIAWVNPPYLPYAPALAQSGLALERCVVLRPANREDAMWAAEQALRSGACGAVLFWLANEEYSWLRRLQMAAEAGRAMGVSFRNCAAERFSTPAHLRVVLARDEGLLKVRIPKRRGPPLLAPVALEVGRRGRIKPPKVAPCSGSQSNYLPSRSRSPNVPAPVLNR